MRVRLKLLRVHSLAHDGFLLEGDGRELSPPAEHTEHEARRDTWSRLDKRFNTILEVSNGFEDMMRLPPSRAASVVCDTLIARVREGISAFLASVPCGGSGVRSFSHAAAKSPPIKG